MTATYEVIAPGNALVLAPEARYVTETPTGLAFADDTPIEVWGDLVARLQRQQKVIEWAIADAINFGEHAYGEDHAQWIDEVGLAKRTLQNIARIGRLIEPARRRADVSFAHHAEVATLPIPDQDGLLDAAERAGMSRYDLRDAVRERKRQLDGTVADDPAPIALPLSAADLTDEARQAMAWAAARVGQRGRAVYERAWVDALAWSGQQDCFTRELEAP